MFGWMKRMLAKVAGRGRAMPAQAQQPAPVLGLVALGYSPMIDKIEIVKRSQVRKAKLYHVRRKAAKEITKRMKMSMIDITDEVAAPVAGAVPVE